MKSLAVLIFLAWLVVMVPAHWALKALEPTLAAGAVGGTVWRGQTASLMVATGSQWLALGRSEWQVLLRESLRTRALCFRLRSELAEQALQGSFCARGSQSLWVPQVELALPAAATQQPGGLQLAGKLLLSVQNLALHAGQPQGFEARGRWQNAALYDGLGWVELGDLALQTATEQSLPDLLPGTPEWHLVDAGGPLQLDIRLGMDSHGQLRMRGDVEVPPDAPLALQRSLGVIASSRRGNRYTLAIPVVTDPAVTRPDENVY